MEIFTLKLYEFCGHNEILEHLVLKYMLSIRKRGEDYSTLIEIFFRISPIKIVIYNDQKELFQISVTRER